jgi:hypothetical protein
MSEAPRWRTIMLTEYERRIALGYWGEAKALTPGRKSYLNRGDFFAIIGRGEYRVTRPTLDQL